MLEEVMQLISDADYVLIGIGEEFEEKRLFRKEESYIQKEQAIADAKMQWMMPVFYSKLLDEKKSKAVEALQNLKKILDGKNYYIVSTCKSGLLKKVEFEQDRVVMPCGNMVKKQCKNHCGEGLLPVMEQEYENLYQALDTLAFAKVDLGDCPKCGEKLTLNNIYAEGYDENGYLDAWNKYMKWLQLTLNKKLCILELGVNLDFPSVIRWPFEKAGYLNKKANFIRVNEMLYQLTEELGEKGISIPQNAIDWLINNKAK